MNLKLRSDVLQAIRSFFCQNGFLEIETPLRIPAPAPEEYIDAEPSGPWWLQTSPELCMKRMLASGYEQVFQICKCFRARERGGKHLPEFTMLEWYVADANYHTIMTQTEDLIRSVAASLGAPACLTYQNRKVDLEAPFARISVSDAFEQWAPVSAADALKTDDFDHIMITKIEPNLGFSHPTFLYDYPLERGALAKQKQENPLIAERFELYLFGLELCNAFTELTDPREQRQRFESERKKRAHQQKPAYPMPEKFLDALKNMPPAGGNALGIDRLVMLFADAVQIDDVVTFVPEEL